MILFKIFRYFKVPKSWESENSRNGGGEGRGVDAGKFSEI